ncbi:aldo/keto reductase [Tepidibacter hydrothermalis]|uniref:Aldo/keto reductase n=1 Tax=Tepidibacter hydrothermalis TaxID=3036126 RepID=A0ABY8EG37_9FIRM|nr:aldo/keto reductase [Tepidibacter hydrothermalis]WFD10437.1 aldo/keto reductase [Tepidibacter hydrothermalis]
MQYREIPKTGDKISIIGYGCMRFPTRMGRIDEKKAEEQIRYAIDQGVNYFDTAYPYHNGDSERFLGKVFSDASLRSKVKIATKLPPWSVKSRDDMDRILQDQLKKLQVETIDYYLIHGIMGQDVWDRMKQLGVIEFLENARKQGYIKNVGFSCHSDLQTFKNVIDDYDWSMCQIQYNYLDENNQAGTEGLKYAAERDVAVFIMEPLRGGNLAGKIPKQVQEEWDKAEEKRSPAQWALRWIWNHPEVTCVLSGMNNDDHIRENIRTAKTTIAGSMSQDEIDRVERVRDIYKSLTKVPCTACAYCMPCPAGVNIPQCFQQYNNKYLFGGFEARLMYLVQLGGVMSDKSEKASQCINCGKCEKHCPQHIEIRKELKNVSSELEGIIDRPLSWLARRAMRIKKD